MRITLSAHTDLTDETSCHYRNTSIVGIFEFGLVKVAKGVKADDTHMKTLQTYSRIHTKNKGNDERNESWKNLNERGVQRKIDSKAKKN